ncbi:hypothetical protein Drorol1_Dr00013349 [Drosera rotundifolia]
MVAGSNTMQLVMPAESMNLHAQPLVFSNMDGQPAYHQGQAHPECPVAIFWDMENCPVPNDIRPEDVAVNIRMALKFHPLIKGSITTFSAYGDFNYFPRRLREGCQRTGVKLVDVPNGRKDAADKAILIDMFLFALDHRPPSSIMLISGDVDFSPALHVLGQRGYTVILVIPSQGYVSSALSNAGRFVWDWSSIARGEGFVPSSMPLKAPYGSSNFGECVTGYRITEEEEIVYGGTSQRGFYSMNLPGPPVSLSKYNNGSLACYNWRGPTDPSVSHSTQLMPAPSTELNESNWCSQPRDINGLKGELVKLLELSGGRISLDRIPGEYQKHFSRPLLVQDYGACKFVNLIKKMSDVVSISGKGQSKLVYLRSLKAGSTANPQILPRSDRKEKVAQEENDGLDARGGSSDEFSDDVGIVVDGNVGEMPLYEMGNKELEDFKHELQEVLVSFSLGKISLSLFEKMYRQRYKRPLNYQRFGANRLEELFDKMIDVVILTEAPTGEKFLVAVG